MSGKHFFNSASYPRYKNAISFQSNGAEPDNYPIDTYAIISYLAGDALIAYHTALEFHGFAFTVFFQHIFQSTEKIREFQFREERFKVTQYPKSLSRAKHFFLTETVDHHGFIIQVTSIERTIVDVLDRINLSGGLEEIWHSLNTIQEANIKKLWITHYYSTMQQRLQK